MKLAIMQPYLFPYIGYFQLMSEVDEWVVFDDVQFIDKGWINRNRILHPDMDKEWQYITLPLHKRKRFDKISEISIKNDPRWKDEILGKLTSYKRKAPYYYQAVEFVRECLSIDENKLSKYLFRTLNTTADILDIDVYMHLQSEMNLELGEIQHPGQWALRISEALGASEYINPYSGTNIFSESEFRNSGIGLKFIKPKLRAYTQRRGVFVPGLSIIDVMMWNSIEDIRKMLISDYDVIQKSQVDLYE